jgi:predicted RNA methylase
VLDCFSGVATTGIACLRLGRRYIGIELDPKAVGMSIERLKKPWGHFRRVRPAEGQGKLEMEVDR